ncbi:4-hydroxybenzoate octaprenyltransferase [Methylohalobius crimeensis]|uniref:4-hydroxybenzoate octaprenyltransferase n=1 Tax=Methylohalobius crimeensis TaxID=244365 RepID=UPI0003B63103|nr:4-hydroxybenzoate octaprenyltransferase [Methylohalobius crimeensis]
MDWRERLTQYWHLMRFHRPIGMLLLLWPALWALWIAGEGSPDGKIVLVFVLGVALMRAAGCVINDFADRRIDPHVTRTRDRPLAAGRVTSKEALALFAGLCLMAFLLVLQLNRLTVALSVVALFLAASYPFTKRYTHLPQAYLGLAFGWAIPMAFTAQTGTLPGVAWWLLLSAVLWAVIYDTMYAMVDRDDDLKIGVKSSAILFGRYDRLIVGLIQGAMLGVLIWVGYLQNLGGGYWLGLLAAAGMAAYQQFLIRDRNRSECFQAFLNNNWFGGVIFLGIALDYWI